MDTKPEKNILIIEEINQDRSLLYEAISNKFKNQFQVECVRNAQSAIDAFKLQSYDIVFLDAKLSNTTGLALIKELRKIAPKFDFIIVSKETDFNLALESIKMGVSDYLQKPIIV